VLTFLRKKHFWKGTTKRKGVFMSHISIISTPSAPAAIGPYSQAVRGGDWLFTSGQLPLDPGTGELVGENVAEQAGQCLKNLRAVLEAGGSSLERVLKTTVFLVDMGDFAAFNEVYARFFPHTPPARSCVAVKALPRGARVEMEAVALAVSGI
jgi:2-iminobutanoate/2-iminopropanoate deaminase